MHLFLVDLFISIDVLSPMINQIDSKKVIICNINPIQDHGKNKLIKYFIKKKIKYFNFLPISEKKYISYFFTKIVLLLPCLILNKLRKFIQIIYNNKNFTSEKKIKIFLLKNNIKSITYEESAPENYISQFYQVAQELKIEVIKITSGIGVIKDKSVINASKMKFCNKIILPNSMYIINKKFSKKVKIIGSLRYTLHWFKFLNKIQGKVKVDQKKITLGFFKKFYSKEKNIIDKLIEKLNKTNKFNIITREKPRDIFPDKCNIFEEDSFTSSQLIDCSDFILTARPSSILAEALIKNKKVVLLFYANAELYKTPFKRSKAFLKITNEKKILEIFKKKITMNKIHRDTFLTKILYNWKRPKIIKKDLISFYNSLLKIN